MPGSLLVFNQEAYEGCLHGIDEVPNSKQCLMVSAAPAASLVVSPALQATV